MKLTSTILKALVSLTIIASFFLTSCSDLPVENEIINAESSHQWIKLPAKSSLSVETILSTSKMIDGAVGGVLELSSQYPGGPTGTVTLNAKLEVPAGAFTGQKEITFTLDDQNAYTSFGPSGVFNQPLLFSYTVTGVELPENTEFTYVYGAPDGSTENIECDEITGSASSNTLVVKNAKLSHFSQYGFRPRR